VTRHKKIIVKSAIAILIGLSLGFVAIIYFMGSTPPGLSIQDSSPLAWSAPEKYEDNSPLTDDLSGYKIYCWNTASQLILEIEVDDPESSSFEVENFAPGTYQCAMKSISDHGGESALSNVVTRTISPQ